MNGAESVRDKGVKTPVVVLYVLEHCCAIRPEN